MKKTAIKKEHRSLNDVTISDDIFQWYIVIVIAGKEQSIINAINEKVVNFGYQDRIKEIRVLKKIITTEETFNKNDPQLPSSLRDSKTIKWETLPNDQYKKTTIKTINQFPGYTFFNMKIDAQLLYAIRSTAGVLGFIGLHGKGAQPVPISIDEFSGLKDTIEEKIVIDSSKRLVSENVSNVFKVGQTVVILEGEFANQSGLIKQIEGDNVKIEIDLLGRMNVIDINKTNIKLKY